jgi:hypothetical protein
MLAIPQITFDCVAEGKSHFMLTMETELGGAFCSWTYKLIKSEQIYLAEEENLAHSKNVPKLIGDRRTFTMNIEVRGKI